LLGAVKKALTGNTDDRIQTVFSYIDKKEYSEALDVCNRMLEKDPGNAVAYSLRSRVNNHLEKYDANGRRWKIKNRLFVSKM